MKWGFLGLWLLAGAVCAAETDPATLPYLQQHAEDWPKQVALRQPVVFKVMLDGKAAGIATLPAGTEVDLVSVAPEGIGLVSGFNQATVMPEQTDLWDRVKVIRDVRASVPDPSAGDPAVSLQLPANSASADWYHQQLGKLDLWLTKYPMSPLFEQMQARRAAFYAESVRVENGEIRRGLLWYNAEEAAEKNLDFQAEDLLAQLGGDFGAAPTDLEKLAAQIPKYAKTEFHPALVRAALAAIDNLPAQDAATVKQALEAKQAALAADRDQNAANLRAMLNHPYPSWETQPSTPPPPGGVYFLDNYTHRYFLDPGNHTPGDGGIFGVYAHHYPGFLKYYPQDDKISMYPPLSPGDLATANQWLAAIAKDEQQLAQLDQQTAGSDDAVAKQRAAWTERREALAREPIAEEEKVLQDLQGVVILDPAAALAVLQKAEEVWPGNEPADRLALAKAETALARIDAAIAAGKISEAAQDSAAVQKLIAFPASTPRLDRIKKASDEVAPQLASAQELEQAYADRDYGQIAAAPVISPAFTPWQTALGKLVAGQKADSHAAIEEIEPALLRCDPRTALASFHRAKALWPGNPEVAAASRMLWIAAGAAGLVALGILMVIWERLATLVDHLYFKRKMQAKQTKP